MAPVILQSEISGFEKDSYFKLLLVGPPKVGKSLLAATAPNPYVASVEPGMASLRNLSVPYRRFTTSEDLRTLLSIFQQPKEMWGMSLGLGDRVIDTVIIDVLDEVQRIFSGDIMAESGRSFLERSDWSKLSDKMRRFVKGFVAIPAHVIFCCHVMEREDESGRVSILPKLEGGFRDEVAQHVDIAALLETREKSEIIDGQLHTQTLRVLRTRPDQKVNWLGDRLMVLPQDGYILQERKTSSSVTTDLTDLARAAFGKKKQNPPAISIVETPEEDVVQEPAAVVEENSPFSFACEGCGSNVVDPEKDQFELSRLKKDKALCRTCFLSAA